MNWGPAREETLPQLVRFLSDREWGCVTFSSRLINGGTLTLPARRDNRISVCRSDGTDSICGAVLHTGHGFYYPVFHPDDGAASELWISELRKALRLSTSRVHSIMGVKRDVAALENLVPRIASHQIEYYLMVETRNTQTTSSTLPAGLEFRHATPRDAGNLFPLQRAYELEEVLLPGDRFDAETCMYHLGQNLAEQIIYVAEIDGYPVAKAGTNARGFGFDQIGGVFTRPEYRGRGIGAAIMTRLMRMLASERKQCCLFVKIQNAPAIAMYRRLGYVVRDEFRITYY